MSSRIVLDYRKDEELFNETAREWAEAIEKTKKTQVRNFYDNVLELTEKSEKEAWEDVLPFVKMLNSKVSYAENRRVASREFQDMMSQCISQVKEKKDLEVFKLFFEAVIGFFKGRD